MAELRFATIVERQLRLLQHLSETTLARALAGKREHLEDFFRVQEQLEHWLQYVTPLALDTAERAYDAPPPVMRPAPPLPHEEEMYGRAREATAAYEALDEQAQRPRVTFPPEPLWVDDLEQGPGESEP